MKQLYLAVLAFFMFASMAVASTTIEHAQIMLNELGYDAGPADGISGPRTEAALIEFTNDPYLSSFEAMEMLYDAYRNQTGRTVFDILGRPESNLSKPILTFPDTPFGDIEQLRLVRVDGNNVFYGNYCTSAETNIYKIGSDIGVLMGFMKPDNGGYQTIASDNSNWSSNGMTARGTYTEYMQTLAMHALFYNSTDSIEKLGAALIKYARADAFQWYSGSTVYNVIYNDTFGIKSVFTPTIAAWSVLRNIENNLNGDQSKEIDEWMWNVLNRVDYIHQNKVNISSNRNNQRYQLALNLIQIGLLYKSEYFTHRALFEATKISDEQRLDGSLPLETERGEQALHYTGLATNSLMAIAEYASGIGLNLYTDSETQFKPVFEFFILASQDTKLIEEYAGAAQRELKSWHYSGLTQYCTRFPETSGCIETGSGIIRYRDANQYNKLELNMGYDGMMNVCISGLMDASGAKR